VKLGEVYTSPWGRYVVHSEAPVVLRSLDRAAAFVRDPSACDYQLVGSDPVPVQTEPVNGSQTGAARSERRSEVRASESLANGHAEQERHQPAPGIPVQASPHTGPWRPGVNALRAYGLPAWRPCLTRARGEAGEVLAGEHVWFLQDDGSGSLYCPTCRASKPRAVMGPKPWIARIRGALKAGDLALAHELVRLGPNSAPLDESRRAPAQLVHRDAKPANTEVSRVDEISRPVAPIVHRDLKPDNAPRFEITIVCESVKPGCEFRALFFDRATGQHYGGSAPTALEALAWAMDDYCSRVVHGMPWMAACKPSDTPGSRFATLPAARKAA
jgi:hypothetical protein